MSRKSLTITFVLLVVTALAATHVVAQGPARILQGQVMTNSEQPLPGAVVYLKNTKSTAVRSFISDEKGNYRFTSLSPNIDYEIYAEYKGAKSDTKTLSSFDSRATATINLKINTKS